MGPSRRRSSSSGAGNLAERDFRPAFIRSLCDAPSRGVLSRPVRCAPPRPALQRPLVVEGGDGRRGRVPSLRRPRRRFRRSRSGSPSCAAQTRADRSLVAACAFPALAIALVVLTKKPVFSLAAGFAAGVAWLLLRETRAGGAGAARRRAQGRPSPGGGGRGPRGRARRRPRVRLLRRALRRMNTVFKCFMGAWPLLALGRGASPPARARLAPRARFRPHRPRWPRSPAPSRIRSRPSSFRAKWNGPLDGLDGLRWMAREAPGDREAVVWLRTHAVEGAVLAEATGNAYTRLRAHRRRLGTADRPRLGEPRGPLAGRRLRRRDLGPQARPQD